jgi:hypothetical protein
MNAENSQELGRLCADAANGKLVPAVTKQLRMKINILARDDKHGAAFHEAGHCIAAIHFKLQADAYILRVRDPSFEQPAYAGATFHHRTTPFRRAVIGWAGPIAQSLHKVPLADWPVESFEDFQDYMESGGIEEQGQTDNEAMTGHPQQRRALKCAWNIIVSKRDMVARIADRLMREAGR